MIKKRIHFIVMVSLALLGCRERQASNNPEPYTQEGKASFYSGIFIGKETSSGEKYHPDSLTAAHMYLPIGTQVEVTNLENNKSVIVAINDRGPYIDGRIIDLSASAARQLGFVDDGVVDVRLTIVKPADGYSAQDSVAEDRADARDMAGFD